MSDNKDQVYQNKKREALRAIHNANHKFAELKDFADSHDILTTDRKVTLESIREHISILLYFAHEKLD
jgi:hypothetical protein